MVETIRQFCEEYTEYLRDESRSIGKAESISFPKTENEIIDIVKEMADKRCYLTIQGARTGLAAAAVPMGGHIMNLSRMNKITGLSYDDKQGCYFVTVEPGVLLSELRKAVKDKSFDITGWDQASVAALKEYKAGEWFFSPDPTESSATIGGIAACNASGAKTYGYGPMRPYVEALEVVMADGRKLSIKRGEQTAKGRSFTLRLNDGSDISGQLPDYRMPDVKSAAGYYIKDDMDLIDLFIGSEGTLGIITLLKVKLLREPQAVFGVSAFFPDEPTALEYVKALRNENKKLSWNVEPAAIEYFNGGALNLLREEKANNPGFAQIQELKDAYHNAVYTEFHLSSKDEMLNTISRLGDLINALGGDEENTWVANNPRDMEKLLFFRHAVPESVNMLIDQRRKKDPTLTKLGTDMAVPDDKLNEVMDMYNHDIEAEKLYGVIFGHIGNNHLHVNIVPKDAQEYARGKDLYLKWARENVNRGGTVSAEHGIGKLKKAFLMEMYGEKNIDGMRSLKKIFDPSGVLGRDSIFTFEN